MLCVTGYFEFLTFYAIALKARLIKAMGVSPWIRYSRLSPGFGRSDANRENEVSPKRMKVNIFTVVFRIPEFTVPGDTNGGCVFFNRQGRQGFAKGAVKIYSVFSIF
jgi:hypothetical protein